MRTLSLIPEFLKIGIYGIDNPLSVGTPSKLPLKGSSYYCRKIDGLLHEVELVKPASLLSHPEATYLLETILDLDVVYSIAGEEVLRRNLFDSHPTAFVFRLPDLINPSFANAVNLMLEKLRLGTNDFRVMRLGWRAWQRNWSLILNDNRTACPLTNRFTLTDKELGLYPKDWKIIDEDPRKKRKVDNIPYKTTNFGKLVKAFIRGEYERYKCRFKADAKSYLTLKEGRLQQEQSLIIDWKSRTLVLGERVRRIQYESLGLKFAEQACGGEGVAILNLPHRSKLDIKMRSPYRRAVNLILRRLVSGRIVDKPRLKWEWNPAVDKVSEGEKNWELVEELVEEVREGSVEEEKTTIEKNYFNLTEAVDGIEKQVIIRLR